MRYLPTGDWMGKADLHTIQTIGIPSLVLMERASLRCLQVMKDEKLDFSHVLIVCGSGNNGGDGFVLARLLSEENKKVTVVFAGNPDFRTQECIRQMDILDKLKITIHDTIPKDQYSIVIDALFGVGLNRNIEGKYADYIREMNRIDAYKIALDIPSGIHSATGEVLGCAFQANLTVTMQCEKLGTVMTPGHQYAGKVVTVPIGIDLSSFEGNQEICYAYDVEDIRKRLPSRKPDSHKGDYGKVLVIAGSQGMSGAAYFCAAAAYAVGAGLVRIYTVEENRAILQQQLPEAIITTYQQYSEEEVGKLLQWADVVAIGPGISKSKTSAQILEAVLKRIEKPCVIDADGLNLLSENKRDEMLLQLQGKVVLTPHMKEMERLSKSESVSVIKEHRFDLLKRFTSHYLVVCALKDARTVVMENGKSPYVNISGNNSMSKGGSGDVLTGVIAGLLAQNMDPYDAACLGVYMHGYAGDNLKEQKGEYGVLASDLIKELQNCGKWGNE